MAAAVNGGDALRGMALGAGWGALSGAAFGAVGAAYGNAWPWHRIPVRVAASCALAELTGADFIQAAALGLATSISAYLFVDAVGEPPSPEPGEELKFKDYDTKAIQKGKNFGLAVPEGQREIKWYHEHSQFMQTLGKVPLGNAFATYHDNMPIVYQVPRSIWYGAGLAVGPSHVFAGALTLGAHYAATNPAWFGRIR
jgi:hypothetical protein